MGSIGPGGPFQQPFKPQQQAGNQSASGPSFQPQPGVPFVLTPQQAQAAMLLGQLLLAPMSAHANSLDPHQFSLLLKQLLQLPREIQQLLLQLTAGEEAKTLQTLKQLLEAHPQAAISLDALQDMLKQLTRQGEGKLIQLLQSSKTNYTDSSKSMGDMLGMLSQLSERVASSPTEALNTTLLLYLPWYPLAVNQKLTLHFEQAQSDGGEDSAAAEGEDAHLVLLIETNALGRFRVVTIPLAATQLLFHVTHDSQALAFLKPLEARINTALLNAGMQAPELSFKQRGVRPSVFTDSSSVSGAGAALTGELDGQGEDGGNLPDKQSVVVHSVGQVPVAVVQGAYWLARIIFELDRQQALDAARAVQIQE